MSIDFEKKISIRWSDIDPNYHLRHSAYYDLGAQFRTEILAQMGITLATMQAQHFGPVLFREECTFRREIRYGDEVILDVRVKKLKTDFSRWAIEHKFRREDGTLCAVLLVEGAWIDLISRKLTPPPAVGMEAMQSFPRTEDFEQWG